MNVFVTGGTGFVGAHLVKAVRARGDTVTALVRRPALAERLGWGNDVRLLHGDLGDEATLREGCAGADVVYHLAGQIAAKSAAEFMATNRDGTANVLEAARDGGARRVVFVSSLAAAGPTTPGQPIDETRPPAPVTDYGRSKLAAEVLIRAMPPSLPWTIVRPPVVYGEWDRGTLKIFQLARRGLAPVFGDGSQQLSVIHGAGSEYRSDPGVVRCSPVSTPSAVTARPRARPSRATRTASSPSFAFTATRAMLTMKRGLMPIAQTSLRWAKGVSYHAYEGIALNLDERERLVKDLGNNDAMILKNHGLLTCAPSIPECFNNIYRLERACQLQVMALSCNTEIELPPQEVVDEAWRLFQPGVRRRFGLLEWPALLRKLDKTDSSYRN